MDHGKTTLISHLTGIDTDRLSEEKLRGISIELGFAWLDVDGRRLAVIDVPGHERFVRQMIAGAAGIDLVMLVVAADEGVMPQTLEHLDICQLLNVRVGAVVLTKTDLVDDDWLELATDDVVTTVAGTFLDGAPVWHYSAGDEDARAAIVDGLAELTDKARADGQLATRSTDRPFKLSIDRVFTMKGFGTVVTGTTASGELRVGDMVRVQPHGSPGRVRGIQLHGATVSAVGPGQRAAINLQGIEHEHLHRGDVLVAGSGGLEATSMVDAEVRALSRLKAPIKDRAKVLVHVGTAQVQATLALVGHDELKPGDRAPCQLRFDHPVAILPGEPFVIRGFQVLDRYGKTLGGGRALAPQQRRHRRSSSAAAELIEALAGSDPRAAIVRWVAFCGEAGCPAVGQLGLALPFELATIDRAVTEAVQGGELLLQGGLLFAATTVQHLAEAGQHAIAAFHDNQPARYGMLVPELKTRLRGRLAPELFACVLSALTQDGRFLRRGEILARAGFEPRLTVAQQHAVTQVAQALEEGALTPPRVQDLPEALNLSPERITEALELLRQSERVIRVNNDLTFDAACLAELERQLRDYLRRNDSMDTAAFKAMTGASRKWTIPLGEYFDRVRLTIRIGDIRRLRDQGSPPS